MNKTCCFFGHRTVNNRVDLQEKVSRLVEELIKNGFSIFLFGGFGEFDELCYLGWEAKASCMSFVVFSTLCLA